MSKPLCIDLFCGLGGWTEGFLAEGYDCVGFDIERHVYGEQKYPAQLVLQDVLTLHGSQFRNAAVIVASPPCQFFSYTSLPWTKAKRLAESVVSDPVEMERRLSLFRACFRIAEEAERPLVLENVRGAQRWVGRARWAYGATYLWGDVPALMPYGKHRKLANNNSPRLWSERRVQRLGDCLTDGPDYAFYLKGSSSVSRKAASAVIAKIPLAVSQHIARVYKP